MSKPVSAADLQTQAKNTHLPSNESPFMEDGKNFLVLSMSNWILIRLLNDVILISPSLNHQDLLDIQMSDFSGFTGFLRYRLIITGRFLSATSLMA
jgi:hypothetical protein